VVDALLQVIEAEQCCDWPDALDAGPPAPAHSAT
jgi:hypothetical protein